jgi:hypothetical protein
VTPGELSLDPILRATLRLALAWLLLAAALHKLRDPGRFRVALGAYALLPERALGGVAASLAACELLLALGLLLPGAGPLPALGAAGLLGLYAGAMGLGLVRGLHGIDCGCGGPAGPQPISAALVARNALLVAASAVAALPAAPRPLVWIDAITVAGGVAALALLHASAEVAIAAAARLRPHRGEA